MAARTWSKWSHVIAGAVFCLLYFPFDSNPWAWPIAVRGSYTAFVFAIGLGLSLTNADDLFGEPRIPEYVATLLPHHVLIFMPVTLVAYLMLRTVPFLPSWMTEHVPRIGSVWLLCGMVLFYFVGVWEGEWLSGKIKRQREKLDIR